MTTHWHISPGGTPRGRIAVPGDKSISHRAIMLAVLADGVSRIDGFLAGADCLATLAAFEAMGVSIDRDGTRVRVTGVGLNGLQPPAGRLDVGNSGTSMRLLAGLLAGQAFDSSLTGDASLRRRPMNRVITPLREMGARLEGDAQGRAPLTIHGGQPLRGIRYQQPVASAQVKSCLLLAGLYATGQTTVIEPAPSRDHTERMLRAFGVDIVSRRGAISMSGGARLHASDVGVPGDLSSAAFLIVAAAVCPGAEVTVEGVGVNPTRAGLLDVLRAMGADIMLAKRRHAGGEPVADIRVRGGGLQGIDIDPALVPLAIDEFPVIFIAAACAQGTTRLRQAHELRVKESDRIAVMAEGLQRLGVAVQTYADGLDIVGGQLGGGTIDSQGDHRIAMAFAVAGLRAGAPITVRDTANVETSFPGFVETARRIGLDIRV